MDFQYTDAQCAMFASFSKKMEQLKKGELEPCIITSQRGCQMLVHENRTYYYNKERGGIWLCFQSVICKATAVTLKFGNDLDVLVSGVHTCEGDARDEIGDQLAFQTMVELIGDKPPRGFRQKVIEDVLRARYGNAQPSRQEILAAGKRLTYRKKAISLKKHGGQDEDFEEVD